MSVGAVITAAGKSSRMGAFKPLLDIGGVSAAQRVVSVLHAAGAREIVVVTGNNAEELEDNLKHLGVVFLRNHMFEYNEMFDSVKIGLDRLKEKCGKICVTPVDVPLFTSETVKALLKGSAGITIPRHNNQTGHPVILDCSVVSEIMGYEGDGGLKGAISGLLHDTEYIDVSDSGILFDMDTHDDYTAIVNMFLKRQD